MWVKKSFESECRDGRCACAEAMWIRVRSVKEDGTVVGTLANDPFCYPAKWGDRIEVPHDEIARVATGGAEMDEIFEPSWSQVQARPHWRVIAAAALLGGAAVALINTVVVWLKK